MSGRPTALKPVDVAALTELIRFSDFHAGHARSERERAELAALYWHTLQPSYAWARAGWHFHPATLRSLVRRGLAEFKPGYESGYFTRATAAGRLALAAHAAAQAEEASA